MCGNSTMTKKSDKCRSFLEICLCLTFSYKNWSFTTNLDEISSWNKGSREAAYTECTQRLRFISPNFRNTTEASKSGFCFSWSTFTVSGEGQTALGSCAAHMMCVSSAWRYLWRWPWREPGANHSTSINLWWLVAWIWSESWKIQNTKLKPEQNVSELWLNPCLR